MYIWPCAQSNSQSYSRLVTLPLLDGCIYDYEFVCVCVCLCLVVILVKRVAATATEAVVIRTAVGRKIR